jgi:hypothetical protein
MASITWGRDVADAYDATYAAMFELSPQMVDRLRAKPGAGAVPVTIGDMTTTRVPGAFGVGRLAMTWC